MVDQKNSLSVTRQCELLALPRSTFYHTPVAITDEELRVMSLIDRCHLKYPFYGSRRIRDWLETQGEQVNRKRIQRIMRTMGITALYPKKTSVKLIKRTKFTRIYCAILSLTDPTKFGRLTSLISQWRKVSSILSQ